MSHATMSNINIQNATNWVNINRIESFTNVSLGRKKINVMMVFAIPIVLLETPS